MKLKSLLLMIGFCLFTNVFAANNVQFHPKVTNEERISYPRDCEIELINDSYTNVDIWGRFDDKTYLEPFTLYRYAPPRYISLYYYGGCHAGMDLYFRFPYRDEIYSIWVPRDQTVRIVPYLGNQAKVVVQGKK